MQIQKVNSCQAQAVSPPIVSFSRAHHFGDSITTTAQGGCFSQIWKTVTGFFNNLWSFFGLCFGCVKPKTNPITDPAKDPTKEPTREPSKADKSTGPEEDSPPEGPSTPKKGGGGFKMPFGFGGRRDK